MYNFKTMYALGSSSCLLIIFVKKMVKFSRFRPDVAQRVGRGIALLFHDRGTRSE